jgi:hypothetical protein
MLGSVSVDEEETTHGKRIGPRVRHGIGGHPDPHRPAAAAAAGADYCTKGGQSTGVVLLSVAMRE